METVVRGRWLFDMQLLGFLILDQIPLMMISVVQFPTENFWFRFVSRLVTVGLGAYFAYLSVAFLKKRKLIIWTFLRIKETLSVVLLGLVIIFCAGIFGNFSLCLEGLETISNRQDVKEIVQSIPKGPILIFADTIGPIFEEGIFRVGIRAFFEPASKIGVLVSSILFALVYTSTDIGSSVIYRDMSLALSWVYLRTGRFEAAVLTHFIQNVLGILMPQDKIYKSQASSICKFGQSNGNDRNAKKSSLDKPILCSIWCVAICVFFTYIIQWESEREGSQLNDL